MSTPERPQDPGEHGYGGTKQDYPAGDEPDGSGEPPGDADEGDDPREAPDTGEELTDGRHTGASPSRARP